MVSGSRIAVALVCPARVLRDGVSRIRGECADGVSRFATECAAQMGPCAVSRFWFSVGAIPTWQLSLQPVATGAVEEVTNLLKHFGKGPLGGSASRPTCGVCPVRPTIASTSCTTRCIERMCWPKPGVAAVPTAVRRAWTVRRSQTSKRMGWESGWVNWRIPTKNLPRS